MDQPGDAVAAALRALIGGLRPYPAFCLTVTVAVAAPTIGVAVVVAVPLGLSCVAYAALLRRPQSTRTSMPCSCA